MEISQITFIHSFKMAGRTFSVLCKLIALLKLLPVLFGNGSLKLTPESISFCEIPEIAILHHPTLSFGPFYFINFHAVLTSVKVGQIRSS